VIIPSGTSLTIPHPCGHRVGYLTHNWTEAMVADKLVQDCPVCQWANERNWHVVSVSTVTT
jgi:hypothetical protein